MDTGIVSSFSPVSREGLGRFIETVVAVEFLRRKSYGLQKWEINYWKDHQQREVDFVIREGMKVHQLIQVTCASDIRTREVGCIN